MPYPRESFVGIMAAGTLLGTAPGGGMALGATLQFERNAETSGAAGPSSILPLTAHVRRRKPEADRRPRTELRRTMHTLQATRWEYTTLKLDVDRSILGPFIEPRQVSQYLNQFGGDGWELVSMIDVNAGEGRTCDLVAVFKRPAA